MFSDFMIDKITLIKKDGSKFENIPASVQKGKIFVEGSKYLFEPGDLAIRRMSNGAEETFEIIDPGFIEKFHGIDEHYQMDVRKLGLPEAKKAIQNITYNFTGNNSRLNQNSVDNSINVVNINPEIAEHLEALRNEILRLKLSEAEKINAKEIVDAISTQFEKEKPSKVVIQTLLSALPKAASIASIGSFLLSLIK